MKIRMFYSGTHRDSFMMPLTDDRVDLMLQYRVQLIRCEPTSKFDVLGTRCNGNGILHDEFGTFHLNPWTDAEWTTYCENLIEIVRRYWDSKFELTPSLPWYKTLNNRKTEAKITCSLSLGLVDVAAKAHHRYFIIKPRETNFRSFASSKDRLGLFTHRDLSFGWNTRLTRVGNENHSVSYLQNTVLHEFGHTLGLDHVNGKSNDDSAYGVTLEQREDIMGMGHRLTEDEANPWMNQLRQHMIHEDRQDFTLKFKPKVTARQLITYWDNDWAGTSTAPAATGASTGAGTGAGSRAHDGHRH